MLEPKSLSDAKIVSMTSLHLTASSLDFFASVFHFWIYPSSFRLSSWASLTAIFIRAASSSAFCLTSDSRLACAFHSFSSRAKLSSVFSSSLILAVKLTSDFTKWLCFYIFSQPDSLGEKRPQQVCLSVYFLGGSSETPCWKASKLRRYSYRRYIHIVFGEN